MNGNQVREQILSYLLNAVDTNSKTIEELQKLLAEADKKIKALEAEKQRPD